MNDTELVDRLNLEARFLADVLNLNETAATMRTAAEVIAALKAERDEARSLHQELIFQVGKRFRGETRHETAKRYIREHDDHCGHGGPSADLAAILVAERPQETKA